MLSIRKKRIFLFGYKRQSASLRVLSQELTKLGIRHVRRDSSTTKPPRKYDFIIPWGSIDADSHISSAQNKLETFKKLKEANISIPEFSTEYAKAKEWVDAGYRVLCRTLLRASGGKGIHLVNTVAEIVKAPLYVRYQPKKHEYRVHVYRGRVIDVQQKRKRSGVSAESFNKYLRNYAQGWVFCRQNIVEPELLRDLALSVVSSLGLVLGAVDIIYNPATNQLLVLEVNTAPGIEGETVKKYAEAIIQDYKAQQ